MTSPIGIIGNLNVDVLLGPTTAPVWNGEVLAGDIEVRTAGTVGYLALTARSLGLEPRIVSALGTGLFSRYVLDELKAAGIAVDAIRLVPDAADPVTVGLVAGDGQRALVTVVGAHASIDLELYRSAIDWLSLAAEVFLCGTYLLPKLGPKVALTIARECRQRGQGVIFDPSWDPEGWQPSTRQATLEVLKETDLYLPNEAEICALTEIADWRQAALKVAEFAREVVVKRGERGSAALVDGQFVEVPAQPVTARDTTGAGDAFDMGYVWARRQQWPVARRLAFANALAAYVIKQERRSRYPSPEEVMAVME